jgi:hypothetical protein
MECYMMSRERAAPAARAPLSREVWRGRSLRGVAARPWTPKDLQREPQTESGTHDRGAPRSVA